MQNSQSSVGIQSRSVQTKLENRGRLRISCPDQPGIVAAISKFLYDHDANIVESDQHSSEPDLGLFFMRIEFDLPDLDRLMEHLRSEFQPLATQFSMNWELNLAHRPKKIAVFVSKEEHCLLELLWQWQIGDIFVDITAIISNHENAGKTAAVFGIPFHYIPVSATDKPQAEAAQLALLEGQVDLIVLARYMQILSPDFVRRFPNQIINIHHSFLPAFVGQNPYGRAYERGVKLIGATAHYVTADLDAGPIIEQDVHRVSHRDEVDDLKRIGRHVERTVFAKAVKWHLEDRILVHQNKTIVFA